jgi:uncharacterized protein (TIGR02099 family)
MCPASLTPEEMPIRFALRLCKHGAVWGYRLVAIAAWTCALVFVALVLLLRYWILPNIDSYRPRIVQALSQATNQRIDIGRIEGEWDGLRPRLILKDLRLLDREGRERLRLEEVDSTLAWLSLFVGELQFYAIELQHLKLEARRSASGNLEVAGIVLGQSADAGGSGLGDWLLRQHRIVLRDSELTWIDEALSVTPLQLQDVEIRIEQFFGTHRFALRAIPPASLATPIDVRGEMHGRSFGGLEQWSGRIYAVVGQADFAALRQWVQLPAEITEASGGVQVWTDIDGGRPRAVTADVTLSNVRTRLQPELPELKLTALRGRLGWRESGQKLDLWARAVMFATPDGVRLPPADISYSRIREKPGGPEHSEVTFDALDLEAVERLIDRLPVDAAIRTRLSELKPRGTLQDFHVVWQDRFDLSKAYSVRGGFKNVGWHSSGYLPGVSNVTAALTASERGGALTGNVIATQVDMPTVFVAPLPIQRADLKLKWTMAAGLPHVTLERIAISNAHLSGVVSGTYAAAEDGPGSVNLKGSFPKAAGQEAWRYIPLVVPPEVREWLHQGILAATARDVELTLQGDLRKFPFSVPGTGLLQGQAVIEDGVVQFWPGWPKMQGVRARLAVLGNHLEVSSNGARVLGATLRNVKVVIPDLSDHKPMLQARGEADGPTAEFLRFMRESPVHERVGPFIDGMHAVGGGHLTLSVDLPLLHASDVRVSGAYAFAENTLTPGDGLPVVEQLAGSLLFTQDEVNLRDAQGRVFGKPARLSVNTEPGAIVRIQGTGQIDAPVLRRQFNQPLLARLDGTTDWKLTALLQDHRSEITIESSLVGLSASLPAPLNKPAAQRLPLRLERRDAGRAQDLYAFTCGSVLSGQLLVDKAAKTRVIRGEIALSDRAPTPQREGVWIAGQLERLDFDQWQDLLSEKSAGDGAVAWAGMNISARRVRMFSRDFTAMRIDAVRKGSVWLTTLDSNQVAGNIQWSSEGKGAIVGRFTHLELPAPTPEIEPGGGVARESKDLPSMDLTADDFRMGTRQLGSLTLQAAPSGQDWRIDRLDLISPDGSLSAKGVWQAWAVNPRTQVDLKLDVVDINRFFARMQLPKGIEGGKGKLEGSLAWSGPPYAMDVPTLSGKLTLSATKGRFVKVDPGIGKLLHVLSLQTLPKVVTLDFRDMFSEGFAFDQISGKADIVQGVARTQEFSMKGPAARVEMRGEVNLAAETQQLDVKIYPSLSDSIALGTALVNPVVGLGALVVQKALRDPLSHILSFEYHIAGTWTTPSVTKKKREPVQTPQAGRR